MQDGRISTCPRTAIMIVMFPIRTGLFWFIFSLGIHLACFTGYTSDAVHDLIRLCRGSSNPINGPLYTQHSTILTCTLVPLPSILCNGDQTKVRSVSCQTETQTAWRQRVGQRHERPVSGCQMTLNNFISLTPKLPLYLYNNYAL